MINQNYQIPDHINQMINNTINLAQSRGKLPEAYTFSLIARAILAHTIERALERNKKPSDIYCNILNFVMGYWYGLTDGGIPESQRFLLEDFNPEDLK